jgi:cob(I)alamin adenosyltransferase
MIQLTTIYTRGGDKGKTSLGNGKRVLKNDCRLQVIGDIDEANAIIGLACAHATEGASAENISLQLQQLQQDLFDLGADLCLPLEEQKRLRIVRSHVERLENEIDQLNQELQPLTSFVLPGGTKIGAFLHLARTVVRRAERTLVNLMQQEDVNVQALIYLNRLSDYLFVLSRVVNGSQEVLWQPGCNIL